VVIAVILAANALAFADASCPTRELVEAAKKLDKKTVASVIRLADRWKQLARGRSEECTDQLFQEYWGFYHDVQAEQLGRLETLGRKRLNRELAKVGWGIVESEAGDFVAERNDWVVRYLGSSLPPVWKLYLTERIHDISQGLSEDASLTIGWQELGRMLRFWEDFAAAHPNFRGTPAVRLYIDLYLEIFLNGTDNTPIAWNGELDQGLRDAYQTYLKDGPRAAHFDLVRGYFELLKKTNFKIDEEQRAKFLRAHGMTADQGIEPPHY